MTSAGSNGVFAKRLDVVKGASIAEYMMVGVANFDTIKMQASQNLKN